jgi:hypothetical protein
MQLAAGSFTFTEIEATKWHQKARLSLEAGFLVDGSLLSYGRYYLSNCEKIG